MKETRRKLYRVKGIWIVLLMVLLYITAYLTISFEKIYNPFVCLKSAYLLMYDEVCGVGWEGLTRFDTEEAGDIYIQAIPGEIVEAFCQDGGEIEYTEQINNGYEIKRESVAAVYSPEDNYIKVVKKAENTIKPNVVHEMAHYLDLKLGERIIGMQFSQSDEFTLAAAGEIDFVNHITNRLYGQNSYVVKSYEASGTYEEYFASAYMMYTVWPDFLKYVAPETYSYFGSMEQAINEFWQATN